MQFLVLHLDVLSLLLYQNFEFILEVKNLEEITLNLLAFLHGLFGPLRIGLVSFLNSGQSSPIVLQGLLCLS